jgi:hypothetical protein
LAPLPKRRSRDRLRLKLTRKRRPSWKLCPPRARKRPFSQSMASHPKTRCCSCTSTTRSTHLTLSISSPGVSMRLTALSRWQRWLIKPTMTLTARIATPNPVNKIIMIKNPSTTTRNLNMSMLIALLVLTAKVKNQRMPRITKNPRRQAKVKPQKRLKKAKLKVALRRRLSKESLERKRLNLMRARS